MKKYFLIPIVMLAATGFALSKQVSARPICNNVASLISAISAERPVDSLEISILGGTICNRDGDEFICDWPRRLPSEAVMKWHSKVMNEARLLANAFLGCANQNLIPYEWRAVEKRKAGRALTSYNFVSIEEYDTNILITDERGTRKLKLPRVGITFCAHPKGSLRMVIEKGDRPSCFFMEEWK